MTPQNLDPFFSHFDRASERPGEISFIIRSDGQQLQEASYVTIRYREAADVKRLTTELIDTLRLNHVDPHRVHCYRSRGSRAKTTIARIHGLGRLWQHALKAPPAYIIEVIAERYDRLDSEDREKTLIHELLHIPKGFRGGFRPHPGHVTRERIERLHVEFQRRRTRHA